MESQTPPNLSPKWNLIEVESKILISRVQGEEGEGCGRHTVGTALLLDERNVYWGISLKQMGINFQSKAAF
jgi:hypothetical protein